MTTFIITHQFDSDMALELRFYWVWFWTEKVCKCNPRRQNEGSIHDNWKV